MGYDADQFEAVFKFKEGKEEEARQAAIKAIEWFNEDTSLEDMFSDANWQWHDGELYRTDGKLLNHTEDFLIALAPFVEDGSYITMIGEDLNIWRYYFHSGEMDVQGGEITFPKPMSPAKED